MAATIPILSLIAVDQPDIRLMNERGRLKRLPGLFLGNAGRSESAELVVHERQELISRLIATLANRLDELRDFGHGADYSRIRSAAAEVLKV